MKISYRWLARHVDLSGITPQQIVQDLTLSTAEVEKLERFLPHLDTVVVGFVKDRVRHPDADKLAVCSVDVGDGELRQIVCGAPNVAAGQKVAVALPGVELPGDVKIKKSKIRGVESQGMICSERELGLGDEHDGIWVLPAEAQIGRPVARELALEDWVIEIDNKSLTHRPDLWGHRGFAREIAAMHRRELKPIAQTIEEVGGGAPFPVRIADDVQAERGCVRYVAVPIDGVAPRRSPDWLRALLYAVGQRPIDSLVDLSNFVMLDLGQPNHVFDRSSLAPAGILVRSARRDETLRTLDAVERTLVESDLLICSGDAPVALAGVMGGEGSKVAPGTRSLLLELATFHPARVRRTAQRLALRTDSSARFEKSLDPTLPMLAAAHFVDLLRRMEPTLVLPSAVTDVGRWSDPARTIELRCARVRSLLGASIDDAQIVDILARLGFTVRQHGDTLSVGVPSARATKDVTVEQDLIEEVGRIHRYGNIPEANLVAEIAPPVRDESWKRRMLVRAIQDRLAHAARFHETISYSFVADELLQKLGAFEAPHVAVINPVAEGASRMRRSVIPSLLALVPTNRRTRDEVRLFEVGKGYLPEHTDERGQPREVHECGIVLAMPRATTNETARFDAGALARLRFVLEDLFASLGLAHVESRAFESNPSTPQAPEWAHPSRVLEFASDGRVFATIAELDPRVRRALALTGELESDVAVASISLDVLATFERGTRLYRAVPRFPRVKVDVAVAVPRAMRAGEIETLLTRTGKGLVDKVELFDVYTGPSIGEGRKSLAFHVGLQSDERTLGEDDVRKYLQRVERELVQVGAELRREG